MTHMASVDAEGVKAGLLLEAIEAQRKLADDSLRRLKAQTRALATIVRESVRQTLAEEISGLATESRQATEAMRAARRAASARMALWSSGVTALTSTVSVVVISWWLPSQAQVEALRATRDRLAAAVASLEQRGGRIDLRQCGGNGNRLCVRVDRGAPAFGQNGEYLVVKGY